MDLNSPKVSDQDKVELCRKYFFLGLAFLPFLWAVNAVWFFREAFLRSSFEGQKSLRRYVALSGLGALACLLALVAWTSLFLAKRAEWGEVADRLSFNIPTGSM